MILAKDSKQLQMSRFVMSLEILLPTVAEIQDPANFILSE